MGFFVLRVGNSSFYQTDTLVVSSFAYCRNGANAYVFGYGVSKGLDMGFVMGMDGYLGLYFRLLWFRVCGSITLLRFYVSMSWVV